MDHYQIEKIYSQKEIVDFYTKLVACGLYPNEETAFKTVPSEKLKEVLVVGCGAGREVFAISNENRNVFGIDTSQEMIRRARGFQVNYSKNIRFESISLAHFSEGSFKEFSCIWISFGLTGHIISRNERICFLKNIRKILSDDGVCLNFVDIEKSKEKKLYNRKNFGGSFNFHCGFDYFFYQDISLAEKEASQAGFAVDCISEDCLLLTKS